MSLAKSVSRAACETSQRATAVVEPLLIRCGEIVKLLITGRSAAVTLIVWLTVPARLRASSLKSSEGALATCWDMPCAALSVLQGRTTLVPFEIWISSAPVVRQPRLIIVPSAAGFGKAAKETITGGA